MKDKILYFIQSFYELGVIKSIQEKYDCEMYALIDINKHLKKFFLEQNFVTFQKTWYLRDYVEKVNRKPDMEYLSLFEKKYHINLWLIAYMDRNFHEYNRYYKFSDEEILSILEVQCKFFEKILDETKPDFAVITIPDYNQNQLLLEICRAKGIKTLILNPSRLGYRMIISKQVDKLDYYDEIIESYASSKEHTIDELKIFLKAYSQLTSDFKSGYRSSAIKKLKGSINYLLFICNNEYRKYYVNYGRTRWRIVKNEASLFFKKLYRQFFIEKYLLHEIKDNVKFIYFPLHLDPEQSTLMGAPFFTDQLNVIINIAKSLPAEYVLYVKEHPAQILNGWRSIAYYRTILDLPNVKLLHYSVSNDDILQKCSLVITIAGTLGLEAAFYKKPSITFADVIYSGLPSVHRLKSIEELPDTIRLALEKKVNISDLNKFVNCIIDNSFEYNFTQIEVKSQNKFFSGGFFFDAEIPTKEAISFIEEHESIFGKIASEYIKKIEQHKKF